MLLPVHIVAGGLAIVLGATALIAAKGGWLHRKSGLLFVYAMLTMGISASILAFGKSPTNGNVLGGFMTAYFVLTALTAVRPVSAWTRRLDVAALGLAVALAAVEIGAGVNALAHGRSTLDGAPVFMLFFLASVTVAAGAGDARVMRSGPLRGAPRLRRHLWRMCFALFIAAGSFFSIRSRVAKVLPEPFTTPLMRALPVVFVFVAMFYWIWRVRRTRADRGFAGALASALSR
jgi:hypothetical protein